MSNEIAVIPDNDATLAPLDERVRYSQLLATSTLIPNELRNQPANVLMVMDYGRALGVPMMQAVTQINIIKGKPAISPALMSAVVRRAGHKLRITQTGDGQALAVTATLIRHDDPDAPFEVTWDLTRAKRAGLYPGKNDSAWMKYPEQMLRARAIAEVCRQGAEDALMGATYTPEELTASESSAPVADRDVEVTVDVEQQPAPAPEPEPEPAPARESEEPSRADIVAHAVDVLQWTPAQQQVQFDWFTAQRTDKPAGTSYEQFTSAEFSEFADFLTYQINRARAQGASPANDTTY